MTHENTSDFIVWADVETTGIEDRNNKDKLLQVSVLITDKDYNILDEEGYDAKVFYDNAVVAAMMSEVDPFVLDMHNKTGLWGKLHEEGKALRLIDAELSYYIDSIVGAKPASLPRLGGNSITLDRNFLRAYLPDAFSRISHRSYDATSISGFMSKYATQSQRFSRKESSHEAMDDIRQAIAEVKHWDAFMSSKVG